MAANKSSLPVTAEEEDYEDATEDDEEIKDEDEQQRPLKDEPDEALAGVIVELAKKPNTVVAYIVAEEMMV